MSYRAWYFITWLPLLLVDEALVVSGKRFLLIFIATTAPSKNTEHYCGSGRGLPLNASMNNDIIAMFG